MPDFMTKRFLVDEFLLMFMSCHDTDWDRLIPDRIIGKTEDLNLLREKITEYGYILTEDGLIVEVGTA